MRESTKQLIFFAWAIEIVGVTGGAFNSAHVTFGDSLPSTFYGYLPAVPMLAVAVAEVGRVPLASVLYHRSRFIKSLAVLGIVALSYLAVENWSFGFERVVDLRLAPINQASHALTKAEADLSALQNRRDKNAASDSGRRDELRKSLTEQDANIARLNDQLARAQDAHGKILDSIRQSCRLISGTCIVPRSEAEDARFRAENETLNAELVRFREERRKLQSEVDALVSADAGATNILDEQVSAAFLLANEKRQALTDARDGNQIFRLAASWYGVSTTDVTSEQFATARWVFATFSALAVALAGSVCALVHYAPSRVPGAPSPLSQAVAKISRTARAYYARKRKPVVRTVPGPERVVYKDGKEIVEKEVPRFIDQIVLIPCSKIQAPTYINELIRRQDASATDSNVTTLHRKAV